MDEREELVQSIATLTAQLTEKQAQLESQTNKYAPINLHKGCTEPNSHCAGHTTKQAEFEAEKQEKNIKTIIKNKGLNIDYAGNGMLVKTKSVELLSRTSVETSESNDKAAPIKRKRNLEDYRPTDEELNAINKLSNIDLKASDVYVFESMAANTEVDSDFEHFEDKALADMAGKCTDFPIQLDHDRSVRSTVGKLISGRVANRKLYQKFYMLDTPDNKSLIMNLAGGVTNKVSVSFGSLLRNYVCDSCKQCIVSDACPHSPGNVDEKGRTCTISIKAVEAFFEKSIVWLGAQGKAGIRRNDVPSEKALSEANPSQPTIEVKTWKWNGGESYISSGDGYFITMNKDFILTQQANKVTVKANDGDEFEVEGLPENYVSDAIEAGKTYEQVIADLKAILNTQEPTEEEKAVFNNTVFEKGGLVGAIEALDTNTDPSVPNQTSSFDTITSDKSDGDNPVTENQEQAQEAVETEAVVAEVQAAEVAPAAEQPAEVKPEVAEVVEQAEAAKQVDVAAEINKAVQPLTDLVASLVEMVKANNEAITELKANANVSQEDIVRSVLQSLPVLEEEMDLPAPIAKNLSFAEKLRKSLTSDKSLNEST